VPNRVILVSVVLMLMISLVVGCAAPAPEPAPLPPPAPAPAPVPPPAPGEPVTLTLVSFLSSEHIAAIGARHFADEVNRLGNGEITIEYLGGPEICPAAEQPEAVITGVFSINASRGSYHTGILPEADALVLAPTQPWEDRERPEWDWWMGLWESAGVYYLGNWGGGLGAPHNLYTNKAVKTPWDLRRQRFRTVPLYVPFLTALGITTVTMPEGEIYPAMERGTIDGFACPIYAGFNEMGFPEVTDYCIDHEFYRGEQVTVVNLDTWNSIPGHLQELLQKVSFETEMWTFEQISRENAEQRRRAKEAGVEFFKFSEADGEAFVKLAYNAKWEDLKQKVSPENYARLRRLCGY